MSLMRCCLFQLWIFRVQRMVTWRHFVTITVTDIQNCWHLNSIPYLNCLEFNSIGNHGDAKISFLTIWSNYDTNYENDIFKLFVNFWLLKKFRDHKVLLKMTILEWFRGRRKFEFLLFFKFKRNLFSEIFEKLWYFFLSEYWAIVNHLN